MAFPTITYKFNGIENAKHLAELVTQKFSSLDKFVQATSVVTCEVEFEKVAAHQHGRFYRVEANVFVKGVLYRAEATEESFEKSIDEVRHGLEHELSKAKDKHHTQDKDSGRALKGQLLKG